MQFQYLAAAFDSRPADTAVDVVDDAAVVHVAFFGDIQQRIRV